MSGSSPAECLVCRKHRGAVTLLGGVIYEDDLIYLPRPTLG